MQAPETVQSAEPLQSAETLQSPEAGIGLVADLQGWWNAVVDYSVPKLLPTAAILVVAFVVRFVVLRALNRIEKRWVARTETEVDDKVLQSVRKVLRLSVAAWVLWSLAYQWFPSAVAGVAPRPAQWIAAVWIALVFVPVGKLVGDVLAVISSRVVERTDTSLDETALPLLTRFVRFILVALGVVLALDRLGVNIAPLLAGAGVGGLAVGLAAKDSLSNLIAGVLLILDRPFKVGDRIELWSAPRETGTWGDVIEIGLRATHIRNPDNLVVIVPNNEIMQRDIVNYTALGTDIRLRIPFSVAYESELVKAKNILVGVTGEVEGVKPVPAPVVIVRGGGPSEVNLELRVWILDARQRRRIADEITEKAFLAFGDAGVHIPYPRRELFIRREEEAARDEEAAVRDKAGARGRAVPREEAAAREKTAAREEAAARSEPAASG